MILHNAHPHLIESESCKRSGRGLNAVWPQFYPGEPFVPVTSVFILCESMVM